MIAWSYAAHARKWPFRLDGLLFAQSYAVHARKWPFRIDCLLCWLEALRHIPVSGHLASTIRCGCSETTDVHKWPFRLDGLLRFFGISRLMLVYC